MQNESIDLTAPRNLPKMGWERGLHMDHVIPVSKGGPDIKENIKPAHGLCNILKRDKLLPEEPMIDMDGAFVDLAHTEDGFLEDCD